MKLKRFKHFISEAIDNLFIDDKEKRLQYVDQIWDILQHSYAKIGGIHGNGFNSKEEMVDKIPLLKIFRRGDTVKAVMAYKDANGRKSVAMGTDGTSEAKEMVGKMKSDEFKTGRSYVEVSDAALYFLIKKLGIKILEHIVPYEKAVERAKENGDKVEHKSLKAEGKFIDSVIEFIHSKDSYKLNLTVKEKLKIIEALTNACYRRKIGEHFHTKVMLGNLDSAPIKKAN